MGARGPAKKPLELLKASGSWRGDKPEYQNSMKPVYGIPEAPEWLQENERGMAHWDTLTQQLDKINVLAMTDCNALSQYCAVLVQLEDVTKECLGAKATVTRQTNNGPYQTRNPVYQVQSDLLTQAKQYQSLFGLSPSSRSDIQKNPQAKDEGSEKDAYFGKSKTG